MEENKITQKLFDLTGSKPFNLLNEEERKIVLAEMNEEEYNSMYELHHNIASTMKQDIVTPPGSLKDELLLSYYRKYKKEKPKQGIGAVLLFKVPLYQAAAAVLVAVFLSTAFYYFRIAETTGQPQVVYKLKTDTVFVQTNTKKKAKGIQADSLAINNTSEHSASPWEGNRPGSYSLGQDEPKGRTGRSIKQDNDLKQFMVASL